MLLSMLFIIIIVCCFAVSESSSPKNQPITTSVQTKSLMKGSICNTKICSLLYAFGNFLMCIKRLSFSNSLNLNEIRFSNSSNEGSSFLLMFTSNENLYLLFK